jgi:ABC-2 type transport system permease protein
MDFFFRIFMDALYYAVNLAFFRLIYLNTSMLGGWNEHQIMIFVASYLLVDAINMTLTSNNAWWIPIFINRGDLDYYLVRPVSSLFFLSLRDFAVNSFINLLMTVGILIWAISRYPDPIPWTRYPLYLALIFNGAFLYYLIRMLTLIPTFWTHSGRGYDQIFWSTARAMERPDRIFQGWARRLFTWLVPFAVIASFPTRLLLEDFSWAILGHLMVVTGVFFGLVVGFWRVGLRAYSSASS